MNTFRLSLQLLTMASLCVGCGTTRSASTNAQRTWDPKAPGMSLQNPYRTCKPKGSYHYIANEFTCPDGEKPFAGDSQAAARSRAGSMGPHQEVAPGEIFNSHIVDKYLVPCGTGTVEVYICMYHCQ